MIIRVCRRKTLSGAALVDFSLFNLYFLKKWEKSIWHCLSSLYIFTPLNAKCCHLICLFLIPLFLARSPQSANTSSIIADTCWTPTAGPRCGSAPGSGSTKASTSWIITRPGWPGWEPRWSSLIQPPLTPPRASIGMTSTKKTNYPQHSNWTFWRSQRRM